MFSKRHAWRYWEWWGWTSNWSIRTWRKTITYQNMLQNQAANLLGLFECSIFFWWYSQFNLFVTRFKSPKTGKGPQQPLTLIFQSMLEQSLHPISHILYPNNFHTTHWQTWNNLKQTWHIMQQLLGWLQDRFRNYPPPLTHNRTHPPINNLQWTK